MTALEAAYWFMGAGCSLLGMAIGVVLEWLGEAL